MNTEDRLKIQEVIARFANSFDLNDWSRLESCFTESLYTDYSDLRGSAPETVKASNYVAARHKALDHLRVHHLVSNYEIEFLSAERAACRASMIVWRKSDEEEFTSHCAYEFQLTKQDADWKISGIAQKVLWNEGNPLIHKGAK